MGLVWRFKNIGELVGMDSTVQWLFYMLKRDDIFVSIFIDGRSLAVKLWWI